MEKNANISRFELGAQQLAKPRTDSDRERDRRIFEGFREGCKQSLRNRIYPGAAARGFAEAAAARCWFP
jgi:hypothetical protein